MFDSQLSNMNKNVQIPEKSLEKAETSINLRISEGGDDSETVLSAFPDSLKSKGPSNAHSVKRDKYGCEVMYQKALEEEDPPRSRPRYQRRNSAVASMLFPTAPAACCSRPRSLPDLSSSLGKHKRLNPLEALERARKVLEHISDDDEDCLSATGNNGHREVPVPKRIFTGLVKKSGTHDSIAEGEPIRKVRKTADK